MNDVILVLSETKHLFEAVYELFIYPPLVYTRLTIFIKAKLNNQTNIDKFRIVIYRTILTSLS